MRKISYSQAIAEATAQEMERDPRVFIYGIGVPDHKKIFGSTEGLLEKFGSERCFDTPLSEDALTGLGIGAAINGMRPILVHMRVDFLILSVNQLVNMAASYRYASGNSLGVPLVIRAIIGRGWGQGFQHSKSMLSTLAHVPGLKVAIPTTPRDAKGLLISAIRDNDPVVLIEHRWLYWQEDEVPEESYEIPFGLPNILRKGTDLTIVATSWMNVEALEAAAILGRRGISVEIIDPRTIAPFNEKPIVESVKKTGYCIVADNDWLNCGFSAEVAARVTEHCLRDLKAPVARLGFAQTHCPTVRHLEDCFYASAVDIIKTAEMMLGLEPADLSSETFYDYEHKFRGPF